MKPILLFEEMTIPGSELGAESSVPDLLGGGILQNSLDFCLGEEDEIYEGYGQVRGSYPYGHFDGYTRDLKEMCYRTAVLENDYIRAVFLPQLGGRLWSLTDKENGRNLVYSNDCIRFSNLAVRNAWFSGGVEWNLGVIGHTPFTTAQLFTARLKDENGSPILRMYEYERIRRVEYQMDFWLGKTDRYLNCRMRIVNSSKEVVPMYWWSNMAVPEYADGRVIVPAGFAYTGDMNTVTKVGIPIVDGRDISYYKNIPSQVDYFFEIPEEMPKYIAHVDKEGYGLLHLSTDRLKSRKLFSWGNNEGSDRWQEFLTEKGGRYLEIQAGLGKTQYGCIPMAPHTAWEWMEQYGPIQLNPEDVHGPYGKLRDKVSDYVNQERRLRQIDRQLKERRTMAMSAGETVYSGSPDGALKNICRLIDKDRPLSSHLDFGVCHGPQAELESFLETGIFPEPEPEEAPGFFISEELIYHRLKESMETQNRDNWYARYQLGVLFYQKEHVKRAGEELERSFRLKENAWACHGLACVRLMENRQNEAVRWIRRGLASRPDDLSYVKAGFRILRDAQAYQELLEEYGRLSEKLREESRLRFDYLTALYHTGQAGKAYGILGADTDFELADLRECDGSVGRLWERLETVLFGECKEIPHRYQFNAL